MLDQAFTARNVSKFIAKSVVASHVAALAENAIIDHTRFEEDDLIVDLGSRVIGWGVASKLSPVTDAIVDKSADFITARREARKTKKNAKKESE